MIEPRRGNLASRGDSAIPKKQADTKRDLFLVELNAAPTRCEAAVAASQPVEVSAILFGKLAELWLMTTLTI